MTIDNTERRPDPSVEGRTEAEWQFKTGDLEAARHWLETASPEILATIGVPSTLELHDTYFDTSDWRIYRAGYALRIRCAPGHIEACLKALAGPIDGVARRREISEPLPVAIPDHLFESLGAVGTRVSRICGRRTLQAVGELRTRRETRSVQGADGNEGVIALDETTIPGCGAAPSEWIRRIEVEIPVDAIPLFRPFVEKMQEDLSLAAADTTKFECALRARGLDPETPDDLGPTEIDPSLSAAEVAFAVLRKHFAAFVRNEPGARLGDDPRPVHDMRVASRRLRAALGLFADALPARSVASMRAQLRVVAQALGAVRDLDVMIDQIEAWKPRIVATEMIAVEPLLGVLEQRRADARRSLLRILDAPRYERLMASATEILRRGPSVKPPLSAIPIRLVGPALIGRARKKLVKTGREIDAEAPPSAYHDLRIRAKRLRYALEFLEPIYGKPARRMIRALVKLQDVLGLRQDSDTAIAELRKLAAAHADRLPAATMLAIGEIAQLHAGRIGRIHRRFRGAYRPVRGKCWKRLERALVVEAQRFASDLVRDAVRIPASRGDRGKDPWNSTSSVTQSPSIETPSSGPTTEIGP